jgi:hypothetical protein
LRSTRARPTGSWNRMRPNLEISTVIGCRIACSYCPQKTLVQRYRERPTPDRVMSLETFQRCLETVPVEVDIIFAGMAEPWLNPACTDMLEHAHAKGHRVAVYTTLLGMSPGDVERISRVPLYEFCIHLVDGDGQMNLEPTPDFLDVLKMSIRMIPKVGFALHGSLHPAVKAALGRDQPDGSGALISRAGNLPDRSIPKKTGKLMCSACGPKIDHNVLLPNGDVALCCMVYDLKHIIGNLVNGTYESIFISEEYLRVMKGLAGDESIDIACRNCEVSVPA